MVFVRADVQTAHHIAKTAQGAPDVLHRARHVLHRARQVQAELLLKQKFSFYSQDGDL